MLIVVKAENGMQAITYAKAHNIDVTDVRSGPASEWYMVCSDECEHLAVKWFVDPAHLYHETGYPNGTLLWYRLDEKC